MSELRKLCEAILQCPGYPKKENVFTLAKAALVMEEALKGVSSEIGIYVPGAPINIIAIAVTTREALTQVEEILKGTEK